MEIDPDLKFDPDKMLDEMALFEQKNVEVTNDFLGRIQDFRRELKVLENNLVVLQNRIAMLLEEESKMRND